MVAYELGYRTQPSSVLSLSLATFYNVYDDIYSVELLPNTATYRIQNGSEAESWGVELSGVYQALPNWRIRGGYTFLDIDLRSKPGHNFEAAYLSINPEHQFLLQSMIDLPANFELDIIGRYTDGLPQTTATEEVPSYGTINARLAWHYKSFEISLNGQNLLEKHHVEFGSQRIPRSVFGKIIYRL
jgi:iron complex outermembrane receptor protein